MTVIGSVEFEASLSLDKFNKDLNNLIAKNKALTLPINTKLTIDEKSIADARRQFEKQIKNTDDLCVPLRFCDNSISKAKIQLKKEFNDFCIPVKFCKESLGKIQKELSGLTQKYSVFSTVRVVHQNGATRQTEKSSNFQQSQKLSSTPKAITEESLKKVLEKTTISTKTSFSEKLFTGAVASFINPIVQSAGQGLSQHIEKVFGQYIGDFDTFFSKFFDGLENIVKDGLGIGSEILKAVWEESAPEFVKNLTDNFIKSFTSKKSSGNPFDMFIKGLKKDIEYFLKDVREKLIPDLSTARTISAATQKKTSFSQAKKKESGALFLLQELQAIDVERAKRVKEYEDEVKALKFLTRMSVKLENASPKETKQLEDDLKSSPDTSGLIDQLMGFVKNRDLMIEKSIDYLSSIESAIEDLDKRFSESVQAISDAPIPEKIRPAVEDIKAKNKEIQDTRSATKESLTGIFNTGTKSESVEQALISYLASLDDELLNIDFSMIFQGDQGISEALEDVFKNVKTSLESLADLIQEISVPDFEQVKLAILKTNTDIRTSLSKTHVASLEFFNKILGEQLAALVYLAKPIKETDKTKELQKLRSQARGKNPAWFNQSVSNISKQATGSSVDLSRVPLLRQYDSVEGGVSYLPQTGDIAIQKNLMEALQNPTSENFDDIEKIVNAINLAIIEAVQYNFGDIKTPGDAIATLDLEGQGINIDELLQETVFDIVSGMEKTIAEVIESTVSKYPDEAKDAVRDLAIKKFATAKGKIPDQTSVATKQIFTAKAQSSIGTGGINVIQNKIKETVQKRERLIGLLSKDYGVDPDALSEMTEQVNKYTKNVIETYEILAEQLSGLLPRLNSLTSEEIKDLMPHIEDINLLIGRNEEIYNLHINKLKKEYAEKQKRQQMATPEAFQEALKMDDLSPVMQIAGEYGGQDFSYDKFFPVLGTYKSSIEDVKKSPPEQAEKKLKKLTSNFGIPGATLDELETAVNAMAEAAKRFQGLDLKKEYNLTDEEIAALLLYTNVGQFDNVLNSYLRGGMDDPSTEQDIGKAEKNYQRSATIRQKHGDRVETYEDMLSKVQPRFTLDEFNSNKGELEQRLNVYIGMLEKALKKLNVFKPGDPLYRGIGGWATSGFNYQPKSEKKEIFDSFTSTGTDGYSFTGPVQFVIKPSEKKSSDVTAFAPSVLARALPDNTAAREGLTTPGTKYRIVGEIPVNPTDTELSIPSDIKDFDYFDKALSRFKEKKVRDETFRSGTTGEALSGSIYLLEEIDPIKEFVGAVEPLIKKYEAEAQNIASKHQNLIETFVEQVEEVNSIIENIPALPEITSYNEPSVKEFETPPLPKNAIQSSKIIPEYLFRDIAKIFKKTALAQFAGITESVKGIDVNRIIEEAIDKLGDIDPSLIIKELSEKIGNEGILSGVSDYRKSSLNKPLIDDAEIEYIKLYISDSTKEFNQKIKEIKEEIDTFSQAPDLNFEDLTVKLTLIDMAMEDLGSQIENYAGYLEGVAEEKYIPIEEINGLKARINNLKNSRKQIEVSRQKVAEQQDQLYNFPVEPEGKSQGMAMPDLSKISLPEKMMVPAQNQMFGIGGGLLGLLGTGGLGSALSGGALAGGGLLGFGGLAAGGGILAVRKLRPLMERQFPEISKVLYADLTQVFEFTKKGLLYPFQKLKSLMSSGVKTPDVNKSVENADKAIQRASEVIKSLDNLQRLRESFGLLKLNIENMVNKLDLDNIVKRQEIDFSKLNLESSLGGKIKEGSATEQESAIYEAAQSQIKDAELGVKKIQDFVDRLNQIKEQSISILSKDNLSDEDSQTLREFGDEIEEIYRQLEQPVPRLDFLNELEEGGKKGVGFLANLSVSLKELAKGFLYFHVFGFFQNQLQNIASQTFEVTKRFQVLENTINFLSGGTKAGAVQMQFLRSEINRTSSAIEPALQSYKKLAASTRNTPLEGKVTNDLTSALMQAGTVFGLTGEELEGSILAISQIAGKGVVSMEELRGQLAERIPGAFQVAARSMGVTEQELFKLISTGQMAATDFLPKFAAQLNSETAGGVAGASNTVQASLTRLNNAITEIQVSAGKEFQGGLVVGMNALSGVLQVVSKHAGTFVSVLQIAAGVALTYAFPAVVKLAQGLMAIPMASFIATKSILGLKDAIMTMIVPTVAQFATTVAVVWLAVEAFKVLAGVWDAFTSKTQSQVWSETLSKNLQKNKQDVKDLWKEIEKANKINNPNKPDAKPRTEADVAREEIKAQRQGEGLGSKVNRLLNPFESNPYFAWVNPLRGDTLEQDQRLGDALKQTLKDSREVKTLQRDRVSGALKGLKDTIDSSSTQENIKRLKDYNAQLEQLRQKASLTTDPGSQKQIKDQVEQVRKLRDAYGNDLVYSMTEVNIQIENRQKRIKETNDDKLREELRKDLVELEAMKEKLQEIERQTGAQTTLSELMQVLARIRVEMEMFNRVAQEVADKGLRRIAEIELKGLRTDIFASADAALKRSENALELVRNKINISANTIKELKALLKDPMMGQYTEFYSDKSLEQLRVDLEGIDEKDVQRRKALEALILLREQEAGLISLQREEAESILNLEKERSQAVLSRLDRYKAEAQNKGQVQESQLLTAIARRQLKGQVKPEEVEALKSEVSLGLSRRNQKLVEIELETVKKYFKEGKITAEDFANRRRELELQSAQAVQQVTEQELQLRQAVQQKIITQIERRVAEANAVQQQGENAAIQAIRQQQLDRLLIEQEAEVKVSQIRKNSLNQNLQTSQTQLNELRKAYSQRKIEETEFRQRERDLMTQSSDLSRQLVEQDLQIRQQKQQLLLDQLDRENTKLEHQLKLRELAAQLTQKTSQIKREVVLDTRTRSGEDAQTRITRQTEDETLAIQRQTSTLYATELQRRLSTLRTHYNKGEITQREYEDRSRQIEQELTSTIVQLKDYELQQHQRVNQRITEDRTRLYQRMVEDFERAIKKQENILQLSATRQEQRIRQQQLGQIDLVGSQRAEQQAAIALTKIQEEQTKKQLKATLQQIEQVAQLKNKKALTEKEAEDRTADLTQKAEQLRLDLINKQIEKTRQLKDLKILALDDELTRIDTIFQKQEMGLNYELEKRKQIVESLDRAKSVMESQNRLQQALMKGEEQQRQAALDRSRNSEDLLGRLPDLQKRLGESGLTYQQQRGTQYLRELVQKMSGVGMGNAMLPESQLRQVRTNQYNDSVQAEQRLLEMKTRHLEQQQKIQITQTELQKRMNRLTAENAVMEANISLNKARQAELQAKIALEKARINGDPREIQNAQNAYDLAKQGTRLGQQQVGNAIEKLTTANQLSEIDKQATLVEQANERFSLQEANRKALQETALRGGELASQGAIDVDSMIKVDSEAIQFKLEAIAPVVDLTSQINTKLDSLYTAITGVLAKPTAPSVENLTVVSADPTGDSRQVLDDMTRARNMYF